MTHRITYPCASLVLVAAGLGASLTYAGADFPLEKVNFSPSEALVLPGVSGAQLFLAPPEGLREEPPAASSRPLYGTLAIGRVFRLDESQGTGRGYDRLLVDLNGNGTLTDDKPYRAMEVMRPQTAYSVSATFGPVQMPRSANTEAWDPSFYASLTLYMIPVLKKGQTSPGSVVGFLDTKPASYLKARVEMDGVEETVGFIDGNGNLRLDDVAQFTDGPRLKPRDWEWLRADYLFRDKDGSGKFDRRPIRDELELFSNPMYFAGKPYKVTFPASGRLHLEPCAELGTIAVNSDYKLESLVLLRKTQEAKWQVLAPQVVNKMVRAPGGVYRLFSCSYSLTRGKEQFFGIAFASEPGKEIAVQPGQTVSLPCGPPLHATVTASPNQSLLDFLQGDSIDVIVRAQLRGVGGETYTSFYRGPRASKQIVPRFPAYEISGYSPRKFTGMLRGESDGSFAKVVSLPLYVVNWPLLVTTTLDLQSLGFTSSTTATTPLTLHAP